MILTMAVFVMTIKVITALMEYVLRLLALQDIPEPLLQVVPPQLSTIQPNLD